MKKDYTIFFLKVTQREGQIFSYTSLLIYTESLLINKYKLKAIILD